MKNKIKIAFIGCGKLARAMIESMTDPASRAVLKSNGYIFEITAANRHEADLMPVKESCSVTLDNSVAANAADYVVLSVKPQDAATALAGLDLSRKVIISVMAGVSVESLRALTGSNAIIRVMPNLCAAVGESFNAYYASGLSDAQEQVALQILGCFGMPVKLEKESELDVAAVVSGGGPAYVAMFIKAFEDEAISRGIAKELARSMAVQTVLGGALLYERMQSADGIIDGVCSKGGATVLGVEHLKAKNFGDTVRGAFSAAFGRISEMNDEKR